MSSVAKPGALEHAGDELVARAVPAAAAAVGEQHEPVRVVGHSEVAVQPPVANRHANGQRRAVLYASVHGSPPAFVLPPFTIHVG